MNNFNVKDHGVRENMKTGSVRDTQAGKPRFDLIPATCLTKLALHYGAGAEKYDERNWEKGQSITRYMSSAERHFQYFKMGLTDENHLMACVWNLFCIDWTLDQIKAGKLPKELDDRTPEMLGSKICTELFNKIEENIKSKLEKCDKNINKTSEKVSKVKIENAENIGIENFTEYVEVKDGDEIKLDMEGFIPVFSKKEDFIAIGTIEKGFLSYNEDTKKTKYSKKFFDFFNLSIDCEATRIFKEHEKKLVENGEKCILISESVFDEVLMGKEPHLYGFDKELGKIFHICTIDLNHITIPVKSYDKYYSFTIGVR